MERDFHAAIACIKVGRGLAPAEIRLTACGRVAEEELLALMERYPMIRLDKYVIMPNHIHVLLRITQETAGASPRPTTLVCPGHRL